MTEITIDLNADTYNDLTRLADQHGLKVELELKRILENSIQSKTDKQVSATEFLQWAKEFSNQVGPQQSNGVEILRELREHS